MSFCSFLGGEVFKDHFQPGEGLPADPGVLSGGSPAGRAGGVPGQGGTPQVRGFGELQGVSFCRASSLRSFLGWGNPPRWVSGGTGGFGPYRNPLRGEILLMGMGVATRQLAATRVGGCPVSPLLSPLCPHSVLALTP